MSQVVSALSDIVGPIELNVATVCVLAGAVCFVGILLFKLLGFCLSQRKLEKAMVNIPRIPGNSLSHIKQLLSNPPWDVMEEWGEKYGSMVRFSFFGHNVMIVSEPELVKHILTKFRVYQKDSMSYSHFKDILGTGLVTSNGEYWKRQRALVATVFRTTILEEAATISYAATDDLTAKLEKIRGTGKSIQIGEEFRHLTLQVIGKAILSMSFEESDRIFPELYLPIVEECNIRVWHPYRAFLPTPSNFRYRKAVSALNSFVTNLIEERKEQIDNGERDGNVDILDRCIAGVAGRWSKEVVRQLRDEVKTFILAGHETSSMMLTWALYQLTQNPECMKKAKAEADMVFNTPDGSFPPFEKLEKLEYTFNVLRETLRLYSIVPIVNREAHESEDIAGYHIPKGATIAVHIARVHHSEANWKEPMKFQPERFEEYFDPWTFLPFVNGPRNCIGQHFALLESKIVLALLLHRFNWKPAPEETGKRHPYLVPTCPESGMLMQVE